MFFDAPTLAIYCSHLWSYKFTAENVRQYYMNQRASSLLFQACQIIRATLTKLEYHYVIPGPALRGGQIISWTKTFAKVSSIYFVNNFVFLMLLFSGKTYCTCLFPLKMYYYNCYVYSRFVLGLVFSVFIVFANAFRCIHMWNVLYIGKLYNYMHVIACNIRLHCYNCKRVLLYPIIVKVIYFCWSIQLYFTR